MDFAEFVALVLAAAAANVGGIEELLAGRPGSWEAEHVRTLLTSTVGWDEEYLWAHRTEPLVVEVHVDHLLTELGIAGLYAESADELDRQAARIADATGGEVAAREVELDRLAAMQEALEEQMRAEWAAYGQAFAAAVLADLEREPIPGLRVPVQVVIDDRTWQPYPADRGADHLAVGPTV